MQDNIAPPSSDSETAAAAQGSAAAEGGAALNGTERLIASDKVEGTAVYDRQGSRMGSVNTVMIDMVSGQVAYAVMSFGGFLGIGERYHPLPWEMLGYDPQYGRSVYGYYGMPCLS